MEREPILISRRRFVAGSAALAGAAALSLAGCGGATGGAGGPSPTPNRWIRVSTAGLTAGVPQYVEFDLGSPTGAADSAAPASGTAAPAAPASGGAGAGKGATWLVREQDGSIVAFVPICTHQSCEYDWEASTARFACRCHPGRFSIEGKVLEGPPPRPLWRYETRPAGADAIEIGWIDQA
jgi:nitrite reductase/ring-hydroxylating ferredoxin subunit